MTGRCRWSPQVYRIHGYQPGDVTPTRELVLAHKHPQDRERVAGLIRAALAGGEPYVDQHRIVTTDGEIRRVVVAAAADVDEAGAVVGLHGSLVDVTAVPAGAELVAMIRHLHDRVGQLQVALRNRDLIGQAKGMIQLVVRCDEDTAWDVLVRMSQTSNRKVAQLADELNEALTGRQPLTEDLRSSLSTAVDQART